MDRFPLLNSVLIIYTYCVFFSSLFSVFNKMQCCQLLGSDFAFLFQLHLFWFMDTKTHLIHCNECSELTPRNQAKADCWWWCLLCGSQLLMLVHLVVLFFFFFVFLLLVLAAVVSVCFIRCRLLVCRCLTRWMRTRRRTQFNATFIIVCIRLILLVSLFFLFI